MGGEGGGRGRGVIRFQKFDDALLLDFVDL